MSEISEYEHGRFCWVDLSAHDMKAAGAWYSELLGWTVEEQDTQGGPPYAMFMKGDKVIAGIGQTSDEMKQAGVPPMWNNYVSVDDVGAIADKVTSLGGKTIVEPMKVLDAGHLAFFTDPEGATFAVWQAAEHPGATLINEPGAFSWNELLSRDIGKAASFYGELFGWTFVDIPIGHPYKVGKLGDRDQLGLLQIDDNFGPMPAMWSTYFAVADCDATVAKISATGGKVIRPPTDIAPGRFAVVGDPQGGNFNVIQLAKPS